MSLTQRASLGVNRNSMQDTPVFVNIKNRHYSDKFPPTTVPNTAPAPVAKICPVPLPNSDPTAAPVAPPMICPRSFLSSGVLEQADMRATKANKASHELIVTFRFTVFLPSLRSKALFDDKQLVQIHGTVAVLVSIKEIDNFAAHRFAERKYVVVV